MFKCGIVGVSGNRARGLADAYRLIKRGKLACVSSRQTAPLDDFGNEYGIGCRYTEYREMFHKEKPDLLHVNTPPDVRLEILEAAQQAGIPAVLIEKPIACQGEDYTAILDFSKNTQVKVAVNHQLHFHPRRQYLQKFAAEGNIGEIRFIEASAGMNLAFQGTHSLQAIGAFNPVGEPVSVFGQVSGSSGLQDNPRRHYAPDRCLAAIQYHNGIHAVLRCGDIAPRVGTGPVQTHKRVAVYGTEGYIHWTMWTWETSARGTVDKGNHQYPEEDIAGQAGITTAMFDWLEDETLVHPLNLAVSLRDFNIILGLYMSALNRQPVSLPVDPSTDLINGLRQELRNK